MQVDLKDRQKRELDQNYYIEMEKKMRKSVFDNKEL